MTEPRTSGNCPELSSEYSEFPFIVSCLSPWIFMPFINAFGCFLAGCLADLFYRWMGSFTAELWLTSWIFFQIALCCPQLAVSHLCRQVICIHANSQHFLTSKKIRKDYFPYTENFYCTGQSGTQNFLCPPIILHFLTLRTCLSYMKKSIWLFLPASICTRRLGRTA